MHLETNQVGCIYRISFFLCLKKRLIESPNQFLCDASGKKVHMALGHRNRKNKLTSEALLPVYIKMSC